MSANPVDRPDRLATAAAGQGVVAWYAEGFSDQLGDRLLLFDNTNARPLELLRVAERLTASPGFEPALRQQVERLKPFRHPSFAVVRGVSVLAEPVPQLAVVSDHIPGERLSNILRAARRAGYKPDPGTAVWLLRQLMPAVAALHEMGAEIAHGTLSPDRIVVTPTGDLVVTEYVFAHAIDQLGASPGELWRTLGVAVKDTKPLRTLDQRADIEQVALLALAVLLGRPLHKDEYPARVTELLNEACDPGRWSFVAPLRQWLGRALAVDEGPDFESAGHALTALEQLLPRISGRWTPRLLPQNLDGAVTKPASAPESTTPAASPVPPPKAAAVTSAPTGVVPVAPGASGPSGARRWIAPPPGPEPAATGRPAGGYAQPPAPDATDGAVSATWPLPAAVARARSARFRFPLFRSAKTAGRPATDADVIVRLRRRTRILGAIAVAEAACLVVLLIGGSSAPPDGGVTMLAATAVPQQPATPTTAAPETTGHATGPSDASPREEPSRETPTRRPGWISVTAPIEVEVYAGDRLLGRGRRTRFSLLPGRYVITLVNDKRNVYVEQPIEIVEGQVAALTPSFD